MAAYRMNGMAFNFFDAALIISSAGICSMLGAHSGLYGLVIQEPDTSELLVFGKVILLIWSSEPLLPGSSFMLSGILPGQHVRPDRDYQA